MFYRYNPNPDAILNLKNIEPEMTKYAPTMPARVPLYLTRYMINNPCLYQLESGQT